MAPSRDNQRRTTDQILRDRDPRVNRDTLHNTGGEALSKASHSYSLDRSSLGHRTHGCYALTSIARGLARKRRLHVQRYGLR